MQPHILVADKTAASTQEQGLGIQEQGLGSVLGVIQMLLTVHS